IYIDHTAINAWQYVSIPFSIQDDDTFKAYAISKAYINLLTDGTGEYQISDFRIKEGSMYKLKLSKLNSYYPSISEFYSVRLELKNGKSQTIVLDHNNFLTESDILICYKNRNLDKNKAFDFVYSNSTKRIANVSKVYFRVYKDISSTGLDDEYEVFYSDLEYITHASDNSCITSKRYLFTEKEMIEITGSTFKDETTGGENMVFYDYYGRVLSQTDCYGKCIKNEYDSYGNLIRTKAFLVDDLQDDGTIKPGKKMLDTRYIYDDESKEGKFRETVVDTRVQNSKVKINLNKKMLNTVESIEVGNNYSKKFSYDVLNRLEEVAKHFDFIKKVYNHFTYDSLGRIKTVTDTDKYYFGFDYDLYGNISNYYIKNNEERIDIKSKTISKSEYGGEKYEEINLLTSSKTTTDNDKYGRPTKISHLQNRITTSAIMTYQAQDEKINLSSYSTPLTESHSMAKIKTIDDNFEQSKTTFFYDNNNDACGYEITKNDSTYLKIQQVDSL
ncbi:MAG: hypothetical protein K2G50_03400, partial [Anaeroplasmataceae bacterium]|nr:hypothetical protein [Anaeroplasmataceae bacterium]